MIKQQLGEYIDAMCRSSCAFLASTLSVPELEESPDVDPLNTGRLPDQNLSVSTIHSLNAPELENTTFVPSAIKPNFLIIIIQGGRRNDRDAQATRIE